jgi:uncharacterized membrane protein
MCWPCPFSAFTVLQIGYSHDKSSTALLGLIVLALSVGALLLKGRDHGGVRALAYTAFGAEILYLASETIGSLLGTSAFFLLSGIIVMVIAWLMIRIEKADQGPSPRRSRIMNGASMKYILAAIVALIQTGVLGYMIESRASILRHRP